MGLWAGRPSTDEIAAAETDHSVRTPMQCIECGRDTVKLVKARSKQRPADPASPAWHCPVCGFVRFIPVVSWRPDA